MSRRLSREPSSGGHGHARELAALSLDEALSPGDAAWLADHQAACEPCRTISAAYEEQRTLLRSLRDAEPLAPRDLWARTSAAIDAASARDSGQARRFGGFGRFPLVPVAGLMVVAIAVGAGLLNGVNLFPSHDSTTKGDGSPAPTPIAGTAGEVQVLSRAADGVLELSTRRYESVCPVGADACGTSAANDTTRLSSSLADLGSFDAFISPSRDHIVVMQKGATATGVYVVPVLVAPTPTTSPTPAPPFLSPSPATASPTPPAASGSPDASMTPPATVSPPPTGSPGATESPAATTGASATPSVSPVASPDGPSPSPLSSIQVTPTPGGALEIARDVIIVGSVSGYSPDGTRFAFTARPADGSAGPDVYIWHTTDSEALRVTTDHASLFAAWLGDQLLVSRAIDGTPETVVLDPATGAEQSVDAARMWRPTVGPGGRLGVWWDGTVQLAGDGLTWAPAEGRLVLGAWPDGVGAKVLASGAVGDWQVRWDETGTALAVWVSDGSPVEAGQAGRLSLYAVDAVTGAVNLAKPLLANASAYEGFSLQAGRIAWSAPDGADTIVQVLAWSGDTVGQLQLSTEHGVTVVR